ncbi:redoxin NrdH [Mycobacterium avium subsp. hominissuis]
MLGHGKQQVIVYTKPACPQCEQTKKWLDGRGIAYETRDVTVDPAAREEALALGYTAAPVVVADGDHWSGFRLDRLKALVNAAA